MRMNSPHSQAQHETLHDQRKRSPFRDNPSTTDLKKKILIWWWENISRCYAKEQLSGDFSGSLDYPPSHFISKVNFKQAWVSETLRTLHADGSVGPKPRPGLLESPCESSSKEEGHGGEQSSHIAAYFPSWSDLCGQNCSLWTYNKQGLEN